MKMNDFIISVAKTIAVLLMIGIVSWIGLLCAGAYQYQKYGEKINESELYLSIQIGEINSMANNFYDMISIELKTMYKEIDKWRVQAQKIIDRQKDQAAEIKALERRILELECKSIHCEKNNGN